MQLYIHAAPSVHYETYMLRFLTDKLEAVRWALK